MKKRFSTEFTPRFSDFDAQGILNSKQYLDFLTEARMDQMTRCYLVPMDAYHKRNQTWVFSAFAIKFYKPIFMGVRFEVETEVTSIAGQVATIEFLFKNAKNGQELAGGTAAYHLVDFKTKKPIDIPQEDIDVFLSKP